MTDQDAVDPPDNMAGDDAFSFTTTGLALRIHDIQGAPHLSPLRRQVVTQRARRRDRLAPTASTCRTRTPDARRRTSEGIFVFTASRRGCRSATAVQVSGRSRSSAAGWRPRRT